MKNCEARQYSDQKVCHRCGLVWDMNDPDPPDCLTVFEIEMSKMRAIANECQTKQDI